MNIRQYFIHRFIIKNGELTGELVAKVTSEGSVMEFPDFYSDNKKTIKILFSDDQFDKVVAYLNKKDRVGCIKYLRELFASPGDLDLKLLSQFINFIYKYAGREGQYKKYKADILAKKPLVSLDEDERPGCARAILSQNYTDLENTNLNEEKTLTAIKNLLADRINYCSNYQLAPLLAPLMHLIALSSKKKFLPEEVLKKDKSLKTILSKNANFIKDKCKASAEGGYTRKHTLFVYSPEPGSNSSRNNNSDVIVSRVFHEATHYAAFEIMEGNICNPYKKNDVQAQKQFIDIVDRIRIASRSWVGDSRKENNFLTMINSVFTGRYTKEEYSREIFAKISEAIGMFGYEDGLILLNQYVPDLIRFFNEKFNPFCIEYLIHNNVEKYISLDSSFSDFLKQYRPGETLEISIPEEKIESSVIEHMQNINLIKDEINQLFEKHSITTSLEEWDSTIKSCSSFWMSIKNMEKLKKTIFAINESLNFYSFYSYDKCLTGSVWRKSNKICEELKIEINEILIRVNNIVVPEIIKKIEVVTQWDENDKKNINFDLLKEKVLNSTNLKQLWEYTYNSVKHNLVKCYIGNITMAESLEELISAVKADVNSQALSLQKNTGFSQYFANSTSMNFMLNLQFELDALIANMVSLTVKNVSSL